jgi:hypothetical protein
MHDHWYRVPSPGQTSRSAAGRSRAASVQQRWLALVLAVSQSLACARSTAGVSAAPAASAALSNASVLRYRLPLRGNPVDVGGALRCYTDCQPKTSPEKYLECLEACPGFETQPGIACAPDEVPPIAACFTARKVSLSSEPRQGAIVIGTMGGFAWVVALASVCASSSTQCHAVVPDRP